MQKAAIVYLTRQRDLWMFVHSLKLLYKNFNNQYNYPVVVFHDDVQQIQVSAVLMEMNKYLGRIPNLKFERLNLDVPEEVSKDIFKYDHPDGHPISLNHFSFGYRSMCRFFSGLVMNHTAMKPYKYYMRMDSDSFMLSPIEIDPFEYMSKYGFEYADASCTDFQVQGSCSWKYAGKEVIWAREGLWEATKEFMSINSHRIKDPIVEYEGELFNTNMEIVDMDFFRGNDYQDYFKYLDLTGNIYYKRWGDAPIRWLGIRLFMNPSKVLWGKDVFKFCYQHGSMINGMQYADAESINLLPQIFKNCFIKTKQEQDAPTS